MDSRKLCELFLVVLTLCSVKSNLQLQKKECLLNLKKNAFAIIVPYMKALKFSCTNVGREDDPTCIFNWTLDGNSCVFNEPLQQMISDSTRECVNITGQHQVKTCTTPAFMSCLCCFIIRKI